MFILYLFKVEMSEFQAQAFEQIYLMKAEMDLVDYAALILVSWYPIVQWDAAGNRMEQSFYLEGLDPAQY